MYAGLPVSTGLTLPVSKAMPFPLTGFHISKKISNHPKQTCSSVSASFQRKDNQKSDYKSGHNFVFWLFYFPWKLWHKESWMALLKHVNFSNMGQVRNHDLILFPSKTWHWTQLLEHLKASWNDIFFDWLLYTSFCLPSTDVPISLLPSVPRKMECT